MQVIPVGLGLADDFQLPENSRMIAGLSFWRTTQYLSVTQAFLAGLACAEQKTMSQS
jgi:hypothetical protein